MATPMSAFLSAGASFTPSPVTATIMPRPLSAVTTSILCSGATLAKMTSWSFCSSSWSVASSMPSRSTPVMTRTCLSPRTIPMRRAMASAVSP